jgi:hypothetical protein
MHTEYQRINNGVVLPVNGGIVIFGEVLAHITLAQSCLQAQLDQLEIGRQVVITCESSATHPYLVRFQLDEHHAQKWAPYCDTTQLCTNLQLDTENNQQDLIREILLAMLLGPVAFEFPSYEELQSAVRVRQNIVIASRKTAMAFDTVAAERPDDCWQYHEDTGFTIRPGSSLITSLIKAAQPEVTGKLFSFSCYRATEYVILLGIAQEISFSNPDLYHQLTQHWTRKAIMSGAFHDVFLREYGTIESPLPSHYYVPGDRLWFRNPDGYSSDVPGYEGSWVFYLGNGLFKNFWKHDQPYTLTTKCIEIFHWRNATYQDQQGELRIDENVVANHVRETLANQAEIEAILAKMMRLRDPQGVYAQGGCIDSSREYPRWVCPETTDIILPG